MDKEAINLLQEANILLATAPITACNTVSSPSWRAWVERRKQFLAKVEQVFTEDQARHERQQRGLEEIARISQEAGMYD